ncbi:MAG: hypothetical protein P8N02_08335 [Actinomycetota bacterium]|jgi:hypothetical protein|nr:hypothetical protein [Actinomycetota bacterium]
MADKESGLSAEVKDVVETLRNYAKQETVGPLKGLGRYLGRGIPGAVCMALAVFFLVMAGLRALQTQLTAFDGTFSFVPYLAAMAVLAVVIVLAGVGISRDGKRD